MKKHMRDKKRILGLLKLAIIIVLGNAVFLYMMIGIPVCRTIFKDFTQFEEVTGFYTDNHEKESIETDYLYYRFNDIKIAGYSMYFDKDYKKLKEKYLLKGKEKYKDLIICEGISNDILKEHEIDERKAKKLINDNSTISDYDVLYYVDYLYMNGDEILYKFECVLCDDRNMNILHLAELYPE